MYYFVCTQDVTTKKYKRMQAWTQVEFNLMHDTLTPTIIITTTNKAYYNGNIWPRTRVSSNDMMMTQTSELTLNITCKVNY